MTTLATLKCPHCAAELVTEGISTGQRILCAGCRRPFRLEAGGRAVISASQRLPEPGLRSGTLPGSRPANVARVLGILSFLPLVGLAAVVAGYLGVRDVRRHPGRRGLGRAVFGLVAGTVTTLGWLFVGCIVGFVLSVAHSMKPITDPAEVANIAAGIGPFTVPAGLEPESGEDVRMASIRAVRYRKMKPPAAGVPAALAAGLAVMQQPASAFNDRESLENMLRNQTGHRPWFVPEEKKEVTWTVRGQPVAVQLTLGKNARTGERWREYVAIVIRDQRRLGVMLATGETGGLSEEEVQQFFESFQ